MTYSVGIEKTNWARAALRAWARRAAACGVVLALCVRPWARARGDGVLGYRFENYQEDGGRMRVQTQSVFFDSPLAPWVSLKLTAVHDAISGASPTGSPPPSQIHFVPPSLGGPTGPFSSSVPLARLEDIRWAGSFAPTFNYGPHHLTPEFSYSTEHDYVSRGGALNYALDLNEKNTTLSVGWAHDADTVLAKGFLHQNEDKRTDEIHAGVSQLLDPKTVLALDLTYAYDRGYLNDQYRGVLFANETQLDPTSPALEPESRPRHRDRYSVLASVLREVTSLQGSVEGSYRFYVDSYGIAAHTAQLGWHQKIGPRLLVSPGFRYYWQTAANFYAPQWPDYSTRPTYYSADYRLSRLETLTAGVDVSWRVLEHVTLDASYKRYIMVGLDGVTSQSAYPAANVFSVGARLWF